MINALFYAHIVVAMKTMWEVRNSLSQGEQVANISKLYASFSCLKKIEPEFAGLYVIEEFLYRYGV